MTQAHRETTLRVPALEDVCPGVDFFQKHNITNHTVLQVNGTNGCSLNADLPSHPGATYCLAEDSLSECILQSQHCNEFSDCLDSSDEMDCSQVLAYPIEATTADDHHLLYITLDGTGYFTLQMMQMDELCPSTHYRCTAELLFCLPVYTRCNGFLDCVYGEDEQNCAPQICPGFYACRDSTVCLHRDHLCDGWGQCPLRDDELMCDKTCPSGCVCQGQAAVCNQPFPARLFQQLRYVDARNSKMFLNDFTSNWHLIHLVLLSARF
ncbi:hypothetical protein ACOMHN_049875 [Nucella lapillus]